MSDDGQILSRYLAAPSGHARHTRPDQGRTMSLSRAAGSSLSRCERVTPPRRFGAALRPRHASGGSASLYAPSPPAPCGRLGQAVGRLSQSVVAEVERGTPSKFGNRAGHGRGVPTPTAAPNGTTGRRVLGDPPAVHMCRPPIGRQADERDFVFAEVGLVYCFRPRLNDGFALVDELAPFPVIGICDCCHITSKPCCQDGVNYVSK